MPRRGDKHPGTGSISAAARESGLTRLLPGAAPGWRGANQRYRAIPGVTADVSVGSAKTSIMACAAIRRSRTSSPIISLW